MSTLDTLAEATLKVLGEVQETRRLAQEATAKRDALVVRWAEETDLSQREIGAMIGTSDTYVRKIMQRFGGRRDRP